jgi:hypothetical protein
MGGFAIQKSRTSRIHELREPKGFPKDIFISHLAVATVLPTTTTSC